jgi:hypothetical protein
MSILEKKDGPNANKIWHGLYDNSIYLLAVSLVLYILLPSFLVGETAFRYAFLILSTLILAAGMVYIPGRKKARNGFWFLFLLAILPWLFGRHPDLDNLLLVIFFLLYSWTAFRMTQQVFREKEVDMRVVVGAAVGYLLIGISFTFLCAILVSTYPDSYHGLSDQSSYSFVYYAFVTLSTLGYGDITPITPQAQSLAVFITITGQFYMVVVVAAIVGKYISKD